MSNFTEKVVQEFRKKVTEAFELDLEIVDTLCQFVEAAHQHVGVPSGRARGPRKAQKPRQKSGYNLYVRKLMADEEIKKLQHTEKMAEIGSRWRGLSQDDQQEYKDLAIEENKKNKPAEDKEEPADGDEVVVEA